MDKKLRCKGYSIVHLNVRSFLAHKDEVYTELRGHDFICLTETWLTTFASDKLLVLDGYMMLHQDRMQKNKKGKMKKGGGILLYYKTQYCSFIKLIPEL